MFRTLVKRMGGITFSKIPSEEASKADRVVVLGCGWGGFQLVRLGLGAGGDLSCSSTFELMNV
jgi:hypothetical protein